MVIVDDSAGHLALQAGERLGDYELESPIATGGYGVVWRAHSLSSGEPVAIKILHASLVSSEEAVGRFAYEAEAIDGIEHGGVVKLHDVSRTDDGRPYMVTELIDGEDLGAAIKRGPLRAGRVMAIVEQLASALEAVHRAGFVHRDIKPSNIMITTASRVVLLDFGIAKLAAADGPGLTASQFTVGTPATMAPEQIYGEAVDARTDVYGLGALIYTLLTGELPFAASPPMLLPTLHLHGARPRPSDIAVVSPALDIVVAKAMAPSAADRFQSAGELAKALRVAVAEDGARQSEAREAIGISVVAIAEPVGLDDELVLDDYDAVLEAAATVLEGVGYTCVREAGNTVVFAVELTEDETLERVRAVLRAVLRVLLRTLEARPSAVPQVDFGVLCHIAPQRDNLVELAAWAADAQPGAVCASRSLVRRLGLDASAAAETQNKLLRLTC